MHLYTHKNPLITAIQFDSMERFEEIQDELLNVYGFVSFWQEGDRFRPRIRLGNQKLNDFEKGDKHVNLGDYIVPKEERHQFDVIPYVEFEKLYKPLVIDKIEKI